MSILKVKVLRLQLPVDLIKAVFGKLESQDLDCMLGLLLIIFTNEREIAW